jgi:hypothetical protein
LPLVFPLLPFTPPPLEPATDAFKMKHLLQNFAFGDAGLRVHNPPFPSHVFAIVFEKFFPFI